MSYREFARENATYAEVPLANSDMVKVRAETGIKNHIALWEIMPLSHCQNPCVKATTLLDGYRCPEHTGK